MAKLNEKEKALELRRLGHSYSAIKRFVKVSKGTLSVWLKDHPLPLERIRELRDWNEQRIERYRETRKRKREALLGNIYNQEKYKLLPLSERDIAISGLFLYWGEGGKTKMSEPTLANTNPAIIKAFISWLERDLKIDRNKILIKLHLYTDMNVKEKTLYWSKILSIPLEQFKKPYVKTSSFSSLSYKRGFGHGTCNIMVRDAILGRKIMMGLQVLEDYFNGLVA